jgi:hypothetical protein
MTAHTTIQSSRTAETVVDRKEAVSAWDLAACFQPFRSLPTITVAWADSWPPVSVSKNSVPATVFSDRN